MFNHKALKAILYDKGIKQTELAEAAGIPPNTLCRYIKGRVNDPKPDRIKSIADALGIPVNQIYKEPVEIEKPAPSQKQICFCKWCGGYIGE